MTGNLALLVHSDTGLRQRLGSALADAGMKVLSAASGDEAADRVGDFSLFVPDIVVTPLDGDEGAVIERFRSNPVVGELPIVVLGNGDNDERRRALRAGLSHYLQPPHDAEELLLMIDLALEAHRDERVVSGSLAQLTLPDLLQTAEVARRSGTMRIKADGRTGTLWLRGGRIIDAMVDDGRRGKEAIFAMVLWDEGSFEADFQPVHVPERLSESTSALLLDAMRHRDEAARRADDPPAAALDDPPPPPPRPMLAIDRALGLLNVAAGHARNHLRAKLVARRLEGHRASLLDEHPELRAFEVVDSGSVVFAPTDATDFDDPEALVTAVAAWLRRVFEDLEKALPGRFSLERLWALGQAIRGDLEALGFREALGLPPTPPETAPHEPEETTP